MPRFLTLFQLFFVDNASPSSSRPIVDIDISEPDSEPDAVDEEEASQHRSLHGTKKSSEEREADEDDTSESEEDEQHAPEPLQSSQPSRKAPAWTDPDDVNIQVSLATNNRLRKLREAPDDDAVGGREYERRLRRQYEKINPTPEWATKARKRLHPSQKKRRRGSVSSEGASDEGADDEEYSTVLTSVGGILERTRSKTLVQGTLSIERLRDANISARTEGAVKAIQFHPSLPVLLTTGDDRRLRLFNVCCHV